MSNSVEARAVHFPTVTSREGTQANELPVRTCIGCRRRDQKDSLVRLVIVANVVTIDEASTQPGRGAYLHRDPECWETAVRRKQVGRALRAASRFDASAVDAYLAELTTLTDVRER